MAKQTTNGKAFEYALLNEFSERLKQVTQVTVIKNDIFNNALNCFETFSQKEKDAYSLNASFAVNFLIDLEPRLSNGINKSDVLQFEIVSDKQGQIGDVRDVLAIRSLQKWEIGISAKNNHRAVKHSRLSNDINFGEKWLGVSCSENYFSEIRKSTPCRSRFHDIHLPLSNRQLVAHGVRPGLQHGILSAGR